MLQTEKSSELFYIHLSILSRAYCTQLYLWLSSQRQYKSQKSVQLGSVLNFCRFQQLSKYYQVKRRGINRLSVTSSVELNWIHIKECNRFSTLNNLYCYTNLSIGNSKYWLFYINDVQNCRSIQKTTLKDLDELKFFCSL